MTQDNQSQHSPHKTLGRYLKTMRQRIQETLGETSGAVEIAVEQLDRFERGAERPSEDILMLLISHFGLEEDEAVRVWELAGYDSDSSEFADGFENVSGRESEAPRQPLKQQVVVLALDARVLHANKVAITGDTSGLVLNFLQPDPPGMQGQGMYPVSRIGMSYEQAEQLLVSLQSALLHKQYLHGPKQLPSSLPPSRSHTSETEE